MLGGSGSPERRDMDGDEKQEKYENYIKTLSAAAAVTGRRVPYHLEYIRKYGAGPVPERKLDRARIAEHSRITDYGRDVRN